MPLPSWYPPGPSFCVFVSETSFATNLSAARKLAGKSDVQEQYSQNTSDKRDDENVRGNAVAVPENDQEYDQRYRYQAKQERSAIQVALCVVISH